MKPRIPSTSRAGLVERVLQNKAKFESLVARLDGLSGEDEILRAVEAALDFQRCHSTCYYSCDAIECALAGIAGQHSVSLSARLIPNSVLHVMTTCLPVGGHSRIVERWIARAPETERHSVAILGLSRDVPPPAALMEAVGAHRGDVEWFGSGSKMEKALRLRQKASGFERIVLHVNPDDVVPLLAFGTREFRRPVFLFNHADHVFGLGVAIADAFIDIREYGRDISIRYRGVASSRILHLPFDDGNSRRAKAISQADARDELRLPGDCKIIVSAGSAYKFQRFLQWDFVSYMTNVLKRRSDVRFVIAGPSSYTGRRFRGRIMTIGMVKPDMLMKYFRAADLVVDSFPFGGGTSLQDAVSVGSTVLSLDSIAGKMDYIAKSLAYVRTMDELVAATLRAVEDPSYADCIREDLGNRMQDECLRDKWNDKLSEIFAVASSHDLHKFASMPRLPIDETDLFVEFCHIHLRRRDVLGLASVFSYREDGRKRRTISFFPKRGDETGDLK